MMQKMQISLFYAVHLISFRRPVIVISFDTLLVKVKRTVRYINATRYREGTRVGGADVLSV